VKYLPGLRNSLVAVGPQGADLSEDDGRTWSVLPSLTPLAGFHAISFAPGLKVAWVSGKGGALARLEFKQ